MGDAFELHVELDMEVMEERKAFAFQENGGWDIILGELTPTSSHYRSQARWRFRGNRSPACGGGGGGREHRLHTFLQSRERESHYDAETQTRGIQTASFVPDRKKLRLSVH